MPRLLLALPLLCCLVAVGTAFAATREWTPGTYPNPDLDPASCGRPKGMARSWVCDPDGILSVESANVVEGVIKKILAGEKPYVKAPCGDAGMQGFQVCAWPLRCCAPQPLPLDVVCHSIYEHALVAA